jgi:hypothetical protein
MQAKEDEVSLAQSQLKKRKVTSIEASVVGRWEFF